MEDLLSTVTSVTVTMRTAATETNFSADGSASPSATTPAAVSVPRDGYDLPVNGLAEGKFELIHGVAITCLLVSLISAIITILFTVGGSNNWKIRKFYTWTTGDRMLIYMALMDGTFNMAHMMDHGMYWYQHDHVRPRQLCAFFGFVLSVFVIGQNVLVLYVAVRTCIMVFRMRAQSFGRYDWQPMALSILPGTAATGVLWGLGLLGPSGAFCYMDPVKAPGVLMIFTTAFLVVIGSSNICLYSVTVWRLWFTDRINRRQLGNKNTQLRQSVVKTAWTCSYFIVSFFVQWLPMMVYGAYSLAQVAPPFSLFMAVTTFTNLGGLFNLCIYLLLRYKKRQAQLLARQNAVRGRPVNARQRARHRQRWCDTSFSNNSTSTCNYNSVAPVSPPGSPPLLHGVSRTHFD